MASTRDNTDFLYQTPDLVNPNFESSKHTHNIVHVAELAGLGVGYLTTATLFTRGAVLELPKDISMKSLWENRNHMMSAGSEHLEGLNMLPAGLSALTAGSIALAYGKNWEEKLQGASLGAAEFTAERVAQHFGNKLIDTYFSDFEGKGLVTKNSIRWLSREVGGGVLGLALIPAFNYAFKHIGREIDEALEQKKDPSLNSAHHSHVKHRRRSPDNPTNNKGSIRTKTQIDDENPSRRDVEESIARRIVHGRAF